MEANFSVKLSDSRMNDVSIKNTDYPHRGLNKKRSGLGGTCADFMPSKTTVVSELTWQSSLDEARQLLLS